MSGFSDVDRSPDVDALVRYLSWADAGLAAMKSYMAAAAARAAPGSRVLDLGCGLGFDLERLADIGMHPVGIDTSLEMLGRSRSMTSAPVGAADGAQLPFPSEAFAGCRIERVLQHVVDPALVLNEVARVVRGGGFATIFEPDYRTMRVESDEGADEDLPARLLKVRHPAIGGEVPGLLRRRGFRVLDIVTEASFGFSLDDVPVNIDTVFGVAIAEGRFSRARANRWLTEQRRRTAGGTFRAQWNKVLVIATKLA